MNIKGRKERKEKKSMFVSLQINAWSQAVQGGKRLICETTIPWADRRRSNLRWTSAILKQSVLCLKDYTVSSDTIMVLTQPHIHAHTHKIASACWSFCKGTPTHIAVCSGSLDSRMDRSRNLIEVY